MRLAILFHRFGPYHLARLRSLSEVCDVTAIEFSGVNRDYPWAGDSSEQITFRRVRPFPETDPGNMAGSDVMSRICNVLNDVQPESVAIPGWSEKAALSALRWCLSNGVPGVLMSDSHGMHRRLNPVWEMAKTRLVKLYGAGLVAGSPHRRYLESLGMSADKIFIGYDVVDNNYFAEGSRGGRIDGAWPTVEKSKTYFLSTCRFIPEKNLPVILRAFALYRNRSGSGGWKMVLLGDGPLKFEVIKLQRELGLDGDLVLPGFEQYDRIPIYYSAAGALILPSVSDTWGLAVNEAMACGLPVLVSNRCGCAPDLVQDGRNGFTFDPHDADELAVLMCKIASDQCDRESMGKASQEIIANWTPEVFAQNLVKAVETALASPRPKASLFNRILLKALIDRP